MAADDNNPLAVPLRCVYLYHTAGERDYSRTVAEALTPYNYSGRQLYWLYENEAEGRVAIYRLFGRDGRPFAYSLQPRKGNWHHLDQRLGYASTVQLEGMVPFSPPRWLDELPENSRYQTDYRDFTRPNALYAYPASGSYDPGSETKDQSKSSSWSHRDLVYDSGDFRHTIQINGKGPHLYRWTIENPAISLDPLQIINIGGPGAGGEGLGRGCQGAWGFQDFRGFEGSDPALNVCLTVHNPTQAGSGLSGAPIGSAADTGATQAGSIITDSAQGVNYFDVTVKPFDYLETPPIGNPFSPFPTPPAPCASEHHGQITDGSTAGLWELLRIRQRLDLDYLGRAGVHKLTLEIYTPVPVASMAAEPTSQGIHNLGSSIFLNNAFDDGYIYDPIWHSSPLLLSSYTIPTVTAPGAQSITPWQDWWSFGVDRNLISGSAGIQDWDVPPCLGFLDAVAHIFVGPAGTEPRFQSGQASIFFKSRFPAAAAPDDKFGIGIASRLTQGAGFTDRLTWANIRSLVCIPAEYTDIDELTNTFQSLGRFLQATGSVGGSVSWPAGTTEISLFVITDTFANFQGHVDWLSAQGLI